MALGKLALSALVVCSAAALAEEGTCAAEDGCDEVGLAQLRRAEARVALAVNATSRCSIGCDPHSNPIGRCPDLSDCPASGCCDKAGPTPAPTPSPLPPSGPCKVGCDPHSNPIGRCPDLSDCPASGCCDKAALAQVRVQANASSKCSIGCDPHSNPIGRCPDLSDCPAGCCDKAGPTPAPTPSPSPPSGPCKVGDPHSNPIGRCPDLSDCPASGCCDKAALAQVRVQANASSKCSIGCDPHSNPIGRCPDLSDCPASGCCDKAGPTPAPTPGSGCASNYCCWWPQPGQCGSCGTEWSNRVYLPGSNCPGFNERSDAYSGCHSPGTWCR
ncbi:unnamed protein product [Prorocentrum cordatum]|uniref:Uncharacterized protein n=1 Tax=Prorocentrum cordatum TaxID=2364126 RepID=A0ABN9TX95_9DINO|nr:unnamed protein product [Polarella glacialis]